MNPFPAGPNFPQKDIAKILIIKLRAIGDVLLSTIVINNLRAFYPNARIDFLTEKPGAMVVDGNPKLDHIHVLSKNKGLSSWQRFKADIRFIRNVQRVKYDLVIDYFGNPRSAILTWFSGARLRVGYDYRIRQLAYNHVIKSRASDMHEALWHLDALSYLGIPVIDRKPHFYIKESPQLAQKFWDEHDLNDKKVVGINFSGGWPAKRWPIERFAELVAKLARNYSFKFIILWGPGEYDDAMRLQALTHDLAQAIPKTDLQQLGAILQKLSLMITTDSGPMHIAASLNVPCTAIYGPTNFKLQGPFGNIHEIVVKDDLDCLGCNRLDCDHTSCMNALTVDNVYDAAVKCMQKNGIA